MVGWFLTTSEVKRATVRPMVRVGGLMALVLAAAAASTASAEPLRDGSVDRVGARLDVVLNGRIAPHCEISGGADIDLGELRGGDSAAAGFGLDCNVPFDINVQSARGGLAHVSQPMGEGPFSGTLLYDVKLKVPTRLPDREVVVEANFSSAEMAGRRVLSSGEGIASGQGMLELRTRAPSGAGLLAGRYIETLTMTITPRV